VDLGFYQAFPVIETPRLVLRELADRDAATVLEMFGDPEVTRFYDVTTMTDVAEARALTGRLIRRFHDKTGIRWAIERRDNGAVVGTCGYPAIVVQADRGSIGYELVRREWGNGFASEAVGAIVEFGHRIMKLHRIDALVVRGNEASAAVLRKSGFCNEGVLRDYGRFNGDYQDMEMFAHVAAAAVTATGSGG
jgi:ribosomal-protein-alanine N-acetyltransferase